MTTKEVSLLGSVIGNLVHRIEFLEKELVRASKNQKEIATLVERLQNLIEEHFKLHNRITISREIR